MAKSALTAASVKALKAPPTGQVDHFDKGYPGLALRVSYRGTKAWTFYYRHGGKPRRMVLGQFPSMSLADAHEAWRIMRERVSEGRDPAAERKAEKAAKAAAPDEHDADLFETVARRFIERYAKPKNRSWAETARLLGLVPDPAVTEDANGKPIPAEKRPLIVRGGVCEAWAGKRIQDVTRRDVIELLDGIVDRGATVVANRTLSAVRKMLNWAVDRDIIPASPAAGVKPPSPSRSRDRVLSDDELKAVWKASDSLGTPFAPLVKLLILTGQRIGEVSGMRWSELDLAGGKPSWTLPRERMKADREHVVPLAPQAVAIVEAMVKVGSSDYAFSTTGRTPVSGFSRAKERLDAFLAEAQKPGTDPMPDWVFHDLRRTVASGMARLGVALPVVEKILAHTSGSFAGIVGVYQRHGFDDEKRAALETWAEYVEGLTAK